MVLLILLSGVSVKAQDAGAMQLAEDSLRTLSMRIIQPGEDAQRLEHNQQFKQYFQQVLEQDQHLAWPFDSLKAVAILLSDDASFRVITWYVPLSGGHFQYFGFIQQAAGKNQARQLIELTDQTSAIDSAGFISLTPQRWWGAWYYQMIHERHQGKDLYTLLGWKGKDPSTRQRVIEPLMLTGQGPVFGAPVFEAAQGEAPRTRIIFEYSARVAMSLKYETHAPRPGMTPRPMIVFDRLSPSHENLRGHYQYYVPEVNVVDAFMFEEGKWKFIRDVDARTNRP
ncbi:MAG: hypothetical protein R6U64_06770 [Bacteroidales bacterium]